MVEKVYISCKKGNQSHSSTWGKINHNVRRARKGDAQLNLRPLASFSTSESIHILCELDSHIVDSHMALNHKLHPYDTELLNGD